MAKRETVEEFLARGGQITKCAPGPTPEDTQTTNPTPSAGTTMMTLGEGALYYSETRAKKEKKKKPVTINYSALPAHLLKFVPKD